MRIRKFLPALLGAALFVGAIVAQGQTGSAQSGLTPQQRVEVLRSKLEQTRRTLNSAIAGLNSKDSGDKDAGLDNPRTRLSGLEKEVGSLLSEVMDVRGKQERAERYDVSVVDKLEAAAADLDTRVQAGLRGTVSERQAYTASTETKKKKKGFFGKIFPFGGSDKEKYSELIGTVAPGRDRVLFEEATTEARKNNYETSRALYSVIISTYPDSAYLPLAKLAIADTFYLEGTTSALIQASQYYQDWLTFFPTDPLADDVMLKIAEVEMRRMGLPDRDIQNAKKAEQRIKVMMQQFPNSSLMPEAQVRLQEVQEVLAKHNHLVGDHYMDRYLRGVAPNPKGAQSRYLEIAQKWPKYSGMAEVLSKLARTYIDEEEPDEAAKYLQQLVRYHPNSRFAEKAREQLAAIGVPAPDPDPEALKREEPEGPGFLAGLKIDLMGSTPKTIDKKGILIGGSKAEDLIQKAIENGGILPATVPTVPTRRSAPAQDVRPLPSANPPAKTTGKPTMQPTQPGPPKTGDDPARPPATQPTTPATPPPGGGKP
jgi:outer membrane protein assembly factor BamD